MDDKKKELPIDAGTLVGLRKKLEDRLESGENAGRFGWMVVGRVGGRSLKYRGKDEDFCVDIVEDESDRRNSAKNRIRVMRVPRGTTSPMRSMTTNPATGSNLKGGLSQEEARWVLRSVDYTLSRWTRNEMDPEDTNELGLPDKHRSEPDNDR